jgi:hypothetical protein
VAWAGNSIRYRLDPSPTENTTMLTFIALIAGLAAGYFGRPTLDGLMNKPPATPAPAPIVVPPNTTL